MEERQSYIVNALVDILSSTLVLIFEEQRGGLALATRASKPTYSPYLPSVGC